MPCIPFNGGFICTRGGRPKSCRVPRDGKLCRAKPADRLCDGCDVQMCAGCRVTVTTRGRERDFCPVCFEPVFRSWLKALGVIPTSRDLRRELFRAWARRNQEFFDSIPLSKATLAEEAT